MANATSRYRTKKVEIVDKREVIKPITIKYPLLFLTGIVLLVYFPVFGFGITDLDDKIFINEFSNYYEDLSNFVTSFHRGLFDAVKDPYYRPIFLDSMMINYWISNHGQNLIIYHLINVLLHLVSVLLLYKLFLKLNLNEIHSFALATIFAVHPVLVQAVAWIPGRNDTILAVFTLSFFIFSINYATRAKILDLILSMFFLVFALFTKETAVFAAPAAFVLIVFFLNQRVFSRRNIVQYIFWGLCVGFWYFARSRATIDAEIFSASTFNDFVHRLPLILQYLGKIVLPFNLSVFPMQQDTTIIFGIIALCIGVLSIGINKKRNLFHIIGGVFIFFLFLIPALIVPSSLNEQTFEHRLYLPIIGILLMTKETIFFSDKFSDDRILLYSLGISVLLAGRAYIHQQYFKEPVAFWTQAVGTSPHSSYANMHLSEFEDNLDRKCMLIRRAYHLNNKEKYINFFYAEMLINNGNKDSIIAAEPYLLTEKSISDFYKCDFYLSHVAVEKRDFNKAEQYLLSFLNKTPETTKEGSQANNNLLVIYLSTNQTDKAMSRAKHMKELGLPVPPEVLRQFHL